jgi:hypothetical protein
MNGTKMADQRKERFLQLIARQAADELDRLWEIPDTPTSMAYFYDVLEKTFIRNSPVNAVRSADADKPVIGTYCIFVPEELIYAAGAIPVRLCAGCFDAAKISEDFLPRDCCPLVKSSMGLMLQNGLELFARCDAVIIPTTCDSKRKLGEELSALKQVWMLEVPHIKDALFQGIMAGTDPGAEDEAGKICRHPDGRSCWKDRCKKLCLCAFERLASATGNAQAPGHPGSWRGPSYGAGRRLPPSMPMPMRQWKIGQSTFVAERPIVGKGVQEGRRLSEDTPVSLSRAVPLSSPNLKVVEIGSRGDGRVSLSSTIMRRETDTCMTRLAIRNEISRIRLPPLRPGTWRHASALLLLPTMTG